MRLPHMEGEALQRIILFIRRFFWIGNYEIKFIVKFQSRHHPHDLLGEKPVAGADPLNVCSEHCAGKPCAPSRRDGGNNSMRRSQSFQRFLQARFIAYEIKRNDFDMRIRLCCSAFQRTLP